ncbi:MAG TPA: hypothetical protein VGJ53_01870 [Micromonosporaceae bacterium]|jgi:hypothetical protein
MAYPSVFTDEEWGLLVGLPQSVLTAAAAAEPVGLRRTIAEGDAGLAAIAAGRQSASPLVAAVAEEVISRVGDPEEGEQLSVIRPAEPAEAVASALDRAREAVALLADRVGEGDAGAYRYWLVSIADEVVGAPPAGAPPAPGTDPVTEPERRFRDQLATVLAE